MSALQRRRGCLVGVVVLLVVAAAAALAVRWMLNPNGLRSLAETRLSNALGRPVSIGRVDVSWLPPSVVGSDIRVGGTPGEEQRGVSLQSVRVTPRLSSLLSSPVVIERIVLTGLVLEIGRAPGGGWMLPIPLPGVRQEAESATRRVAVDLAEVVLRDGRVSVAARPPAAGSPPRTATVREIEATLRATGGETSLDSLTASIGRSSVAGTGRIGRDGARFSLAWTSLSSDDLPEVFALLGATAPGGLAIEGEKPLTLDLTVDPAGRMTGTGRISASRASLDTLSLSGLEAPLRLSDKEIVLDPLTFGAYGGTHRGRFSANLEATAVTWTLDSRVESLDVNQLVSAVSSAKGAIDGTGRVEARLRGGAADPVLRTVAGTVATNVANGAIHNFPILAAVDSALKLGLTADRDLRFDTLSATWQVADARAATDDLQALSGEARVTAAGTLAFDQSLDFRGRVAFSKAKSDELVRRVRELDGLRNADGMIEVPVAVSGTVSAPVFAVDAAALLEKAARDELKRRIKKGIERWIK